MQIQTIKTELSINGISIEVGHSFLEDIVKDIPDIAENKEVFSILATSDNPEVRQIIANTKNLSKKAIHPLLNDID